MFHFENKKSADMFLFNVMAVEQWNQVGFHKIQETMQTLWSQDCISEKRISCKLILGSVQIPSGLILDPSEPSGEESCVRRHCSGLLGLHTTLDEQGGDMDIWCRELIAG